MHFSAEGAEQMDYKKDVNNLWFNREQAIYHLYS